MDVLTLDRVGEASRPRERRLPPSSRAVPETSIAAVGDEDVALVAGDASAHAEPCGRITGALLWYAFPHAPRGLGSSARASSPALCPV